MLQEHLSITRLIPVNGARVFFALVAALRMGKNMTVSVSARPALSIPTRRAHDERGSVRAPLLPAASRLVRRLCFPLLFAATRMTHRETRSAATLFEKRSGIRSCLAC